MADQSPFDKFKLEMAAVAPGEVISVDVASFPWTLPPEMIWVRYLLPAMMALRSRVMDASQAPDKAPNPDVLPVSVTVPFPTPAAPSLAVGSDEYIDEVFRYHAPGPEQLAHYEAIRAGAKEFARILAAHTPPSADRTAAFRKLREVVMTANGSVALDGRA